MEETIELISETDDSYIANIDGKHVKLFKINTNEIKERWKKNVDEATKLIPKHHFEVLLKILISTINNIPTVAEYERVSNNIAGHINKLYDMIAPNCNQHFSNIFHYPYKNISTEIYGKAQTFMKEIKSLLDTMNDIGKCMVEQGTLKEFEIMEPRVDDRGVFGFEYKLT